MICVVASLGNVPSRLGCHSCQTRRIWWRKQVRNIAAVHAGQNPCSVPNNCLSQRCHVVSWNPGRKYSETGIKIHHFSMEKTTTHNVVCFVVLNTVPFSPTIQIIKFMGPAWGHLGPVGPRWAPCWPHEPCYQGRCPSICSAVSAFFPISHPGIW